MEERETGKAMLSRRSFLKTTAAMGALAAVGAAPSTALAATEPSIADAQEETFHCVCMGNDSQHCSWDVHVKEGKIVRVNRHEREDARYNRGCLRGLTRTALIYSPERIKYPMKRIEGTARGTQEFERISWDEAYQLLADKIAETRANWGDQAVCFFLSGGICGMIQACGNYPGLIANQINATTRSIDRDAATTAGFYPIIGTTDKWYINEPRDSINSKAIILWGNATEGTPNTQHFFREAQANGTKLVVVDPTYIPVCEAADLWVPIRPGSDSALYLGISHIIFEKDAVDYDFMTNHTCAPFLVRSDTQLFLRPQDIGMEVPTDEKYAYVVYDQDTAAFTTLDKATNPAVYGTFEVNGISVTPSLDLLKQKLEEYTPEKVSEITEVPVDTIYELADICIDGPVFHRLGYGNQIYCNGHMIAHAGMTMAILTGNFGKPGATFGTVRNGIDYVYGKKRSKKSKLGAAKTKKTSKAIPMQWISDVILEEKLPYSGEDYPIKMIFNVGSNLFTGQSDVNRWAAALEKLDFVATCDLDFNDTTLHSDLILPAADWWEKEEFDTSGEFLNFQWNDKAVEPAFESKPENQMMRELAEVMGLSENFNFTDEEYVNSRLNDWLKEDYDIDYANVKKNKCMYYSPKDGSAYVAWDTLDFPTPSHRIEFYCEDPKPRTDYGQEFEVYRLPEFFPPQEIYNEELLAKYPFVCLSRRSYYQVHAMHWNNAILREIDPEPFVQINPTDAEKYGYKNNEYYEFYNDRGSFVARLVYDAGIRPGTVMYPKGWCVKNTKAGRINSVTIGYEHPFGINQSYNDTLVGIREWKEN